MIMKYNDKYMVLITLLLLYSYCHCFHLCKYNNNNRIVSRYDVKNNRRLLLRSNNNNDNDNDNIINEDEKEEESIEDLVRRAKQDMEDKKDAENAADNAKKKEVLKKRADKQYEAYWQKQKELTESSSYQQALMNAYYSESNKVRNVTATTERLAKIKDNDMLKETNSEPLTSKQVIAGTIGSLGLMAAVFAARQVISPSPSKGSSLFGSTKVKRFFESRVIKRDYSIDELRSSLEKSKDSPLSLPPLPKLNNLKCIRGNSNVLLPNNNKIKLILLFQPTNILSLRASAALKKLGSSSDIDIITIVSNVPNPYEIEMLNNNNSDDFGSGLLMPNEIPTNIFVDEDNTITRALRLTYPGLVICLDGSILYALEGQRVMQTGGNAIGAAVGYVTGNRNKGRTTADSWDSNPLLINPTFNPKKLSQPTRLTVGGGFLYISDTGNNRILQVSISDGVVKKVFGSASGTSGKITDGAVNKDIIFNRPMGTAIDFDRNLFVADSGNDQIIKIKLDDGTAVKVSVAEADIDYSGQSYDSANLEEIEKTIGKTLKQLRAMPAEEVQALIVSNDLEDDLLAKRLIGRSRDIVGPTDLTKVDAFVYVSASSSRQVWRIESGGFIIRPTFGTGLPGQGNVKDPLKYLSDLSFVEPNGLTSSSGRIFIVDSGAGSLREVNLISGYSKNILGTGAGSNFFSNEVNSLDNSFGDIDGPGNESKMKFGSSCCTIDTDQLLIADTLSHKIKVVEVRDKGKSRTFLGTGKAGKSINELSYPQGITFDRLSGNIFISDTGNNRIIIIDKNGKNIREMNISFES